MNHVHESCTDMQNIHTPPCDTWRLLTMASEQILYCLKRQWLAYVSKSTIANGYNSYQGMYMTKCECI